MLSRCVECDHILLGDEVEYLYKGKSYCDDCYKAVKKLKTRQIENMNMDKIAVVAITTIVLIFNISLGLAAYGQIDTDVNKDELLRH